MSESSNAATSARICYLDTSLRSDVGHFANSCRHIVGEFRRRGFSVDIYGHRAMMPSLVQELQAIPFFRHGSVENILAHAPISALHRADFCVAQLSFLQDMKRIWSLGPYDFIYVNSIFPPQLAVLARWLRTFEPENVPIVAAEFGTPSGVGMTQRAMRGSLDWRRLSAFYSKAAELLSSSNTHRFLLFTFDAASSADYQDLLHVQIETMPTIHSGLKELRRRYVQNGLLTISFIGHQRVEEGYHLIPDIVHSVRASGRAVQFLVHNGNPEEEQISRQLGVMAKEGSDLIFEHRPAAGAYWQDLLNRSDIVVLPYQRDRYRASYSAVAVEAVSDGIPIVAPAGTTMETLAKSFETGLTTFQSWDAVSVGNAILQAVSNFTELADCSFKGAQRWREANGARHFVHRLFELQPLEHKERSRASLSTYDRIFDFALDLFFTITTRIMIASRFILVSYRRFAGRN